MGPRSRIGRAGLTLLAVGLVSCNEGDTITNNPPPLSATCTATPTAGEAPLEVAFQLNVSGAEGTSSVTVSYGDGATGTDPDATHVYTEGGLFTASFDVRTATQTARCATSVEVSGGATGGGGDGGDGSDNLPPIVDFRTNPRVKGGKIAGTAPFTVNFNMCRTVDPEGDKLWFTMDLDGDKKDDIKGPTGADCREPWTYSAGTYTVRNCVTDLGPANEELHPKQCKNYTVEAS